MRIFLLIISIVLTSFLVNAQVTIDGTIPFQTDPAKKYSIYIPSAYDVNTPNKMMLGFHPFNTNRWDAESWRDTLIVFAESNNLLMVCPDGGVDGKVDDPIDTAFTSFLIDSVLLWYNVDETKIYAMGFSWGGRTTYTYGLNHANRFAGFIPIGAAINGTNEIGSAIAYADEKPFYLVHGAFDSPSNRFYPALDALADNNACVESNLLSGVNHTIDFPNRNAILTEAFVYVDSIVCGISTDVEDLNASSIQLNPSFIQAGGTFRLSFEAAKSHTQVAIFDVEGRPVKTLQFNNSYPELSLSLDDPGFYFIHIDAPSGAIVKKVLVH